MKNEDLGSTFTEVKSDLECKTSSVRHYRLQGASYVSVAKDMQIVVVPAANSWRGHDQVACIVKSLIYVLSTCALQTSKQLKVT